MKRMATMRMMTSAAALVIFGGLVAWMVPPTTPKAPPPSPLAAFAGRGASSPEPGLADTTAMFAGTPSANILPTPALPVGREIRSATDDGRLPNTDDATVQSPDDADATDTGQNDGPEPWPPGSSTTLNMPDMRAQPYVEQRLQWRSNVDALIRRESEAAGGRDEDAPDPE